MKHTIEIRYEWEDMPYLKQVAVDDFKRANGYVSYSYQATINEYDILNYLDINDGTECINSLYDRDLLDDLLDSDEFREWAKDTFEEEAKMEYMEVYL